MSMNPYGPAERPGLFDAESTRLEMVYTSVGFDDLLDITLPLNRGQGDTQIVVTSHEDKATQLVARKHGAVLVVTDRFGFRGRKFNKGAAINTGFARFQYHGWRMCLDGDIVLPPDFRQVLFNHTSLDRSCLYGCDRVDVVGLDELRTLRSRLEAMPQLAWHFLLDPSHHRPVGGRIVHSREGYLPIGCFQLWNASQQREYPHSLGSAEHDDLAFAMTWPEARRRLLPTAFVYHLCARTPALGENWDGHRKQPRIRK